MFEDEEREKRTEQAMNDPQPGDRFSEMYAYWMYVLERNGDTVVIMDANPPCTLPEDGEVKIMTLDDFKEEFAYNTIPGYWITLIDRENNVSGWKEKAKNWKDVKNMCPCCGQVINKEQETLWI